MIKERPPRLFGIKAYRFAVSGVLATGIHVLIAASLIGLLDIYPTVANGIAYLFATLFSYTINTLWSFSSSMRGKNLYRFCWVSVAGGGLAMAVSEMAQQMGMHYLQGIILVVLIVPPVTFLLHSFWTYK